MCEYLNKKYICIFKNKKEKKFDYKVLKWKYKYISTHAFTYICIYNC